MSRIIQQLRQEFLDQLTVMTGKFDNFGLACSGGLDSTVLFSLFCESVKFLKKPNFFLMHVNYGLRGEDSKLDEEAICRWAKDRAIPAYVLNVQDVEGKQQGESTQIWARRVRHDWFLELAERQNACIVLGHHHDDLAENVLLRLGKGSGPAALLGMKKQTGHLWRPLLDYPKKTLENYAQQAGLTHLTDTTNDKLIYDRNRVRHEVLPALESVFPQMRRKLVALGEDCEQMSAFIDQLFSAHFFANGEKHLALSDLEDLPPTVFFALVRRLCVESGWSYPRLNRLQLSKIYKRIQRHKNLSGRRNQLEWPLSAGQRLVLDQGRLVLAAENSSAYHS